MSYDENRISDLIDAGLKDQKDLQNTELLPDFFSGTGEVKGFDFIKVSKYPNCYIYLITDMENGSQHYEVIKRIVVNKFDFATNTAIPETKETYPKAKDFGTKAWTYNNLKDCYPKVNELNPINS